MKIKLVCVCLLAVLVSGCTDMFKSDVKYSVSGTASSVSLTYENEDGGTSQVSSVPLPWSYSFKAKEGDFLYISAQNNSSSGSVNVKISVNGDTRKSSSSDGAYVIATASDSL